ncbi:MAG TPA: S8 family serine peptidase [bacterium]
MVLLSQHPARAQSHALARLIKDKQNVSAAEAKISSSIRETIQRLKLQGVNLLNAQSRQASALSNSIVRIDNSANIQSYIYLKDTRADYIAEMRQHQIRIEMVGAEWGIVQGWVPFTQFDDLANLDYVSLITPPDYAIHMTGSVTTEGDAILRANEVRSNLGITGSGVRVGVISDGIDTRLNAIATQDLPALIGIYSKMSGEGDEGTAMLEIVHDLAPGAGLAFAGPNTSLEMVSAIRFLADSIFSGAGCQIVVDDLGFITEPAFQDGIIAQAVNGVAATGTIYFTAAGNIASDHYERDYVPGTFTFQQEQVAAHDFGLAAGGASDPTMRIQVNDGGSLTVVLHWNDPSPASANDYDLALIHAGVDSLLDSAADFQTGTQRPLEVAEFENQSGADIAVNLVIVNSGANTRLLELVMIGSGFNVEEYGVSEGSIAPGHQAATGAITVGAIFVLDSGNDTIESFSSRGPARVFFPQQEERMKPDFAALDGGLITGAGDFGQEFPAGSGNIRFFGTSAAAPHAAGVGALILSANPNLTPTQVRNALINSAVDLGTPGADNTFGAGRIDAFAAVQLVVGVEDGDGSNLPAQFSLAQNYPNPFNPTTLIQYSLPAAHGNGLVSLEIYNLLGQKVRTLVNAPQLAGMHQVEWDGLNDAGKSAGSGLFLYRMQAGEFVETRKMALVR